MFRYQLLLYLGLLVSPIVGLMRILRRKDTLRSFWYRFFPERTQAAGVIWLHAVSLGELQVLELCLPILRKKNPDAPLLVTVSNANAYSLAKSKLKGLAMVTLAPLDFHFSLRRFFKGWNPIALITIENEVFPNRLSYCSRLGIPAYFVNARLSMKSYQSWAKRPGFAHSVFSSIAHVWAQDERSGAYFRNLGTAAKSVEIIPNLKRLVEVQLTHEHIELPFNRSKTLLAASTHPGEDEILLDAFAQLKKSDPEYRMIIAPRHPERAADIRKLVLSRGYFLAQRSQNEAPDPETDIYLADTFREMHLWYANAAFTFVAGSLFPIGGHTPYEPIRHQSVVLHGPHFSNFETEYNSLRKMKGAIECASAEQISTSILSLSQRKQREMFKRAASALINPTEDQKVLDDLISKLLVDLHARR